MILTIDVGNSNIVIGAFEGRELTFSARLNTVKNRLADEYAIDLKNLFELHKKPRQVSGAALSSVVPVLTKVMTQAIRLVFGIDTFVIGPGIKTGLNIKIDNPSQLGSDIMADAVGAFAQYKPPIMIFDLGTATTISIVDEGGNILGGAIMPGVRLSLDALSSRAAQLPEISLVAPRDIIGTNTIDCMRSGVIYGNASMIDGMIERMRQRLGQDITVVATGGMASVIAPHCKNEIIINQSLQFEGLLELYHKNH